MASQGYVRLAGFCFGLARGFLLSGAGAVLILFAVFLFCLQPKPLNQQNGQVCQICGDDVGLNPDGEPFVACNECAFPICRDCYEYERREGTQNCPQCKTRFKRLKGKSPVSPSQCSTNARSPISAESCLARSCSKGIRLLQGARVYRGMRRRTASMTWRTSSTGRTSTTPSMSPSPCSTPT